MSSCPLTLMIQHSLYLKLYLILCPLVADVGFLIEMLHFQLHDVSSLTTIHAMHKPSHLNKILLNAG